MKITQTKFFVFIFLFTVPVFSCMPEKDVNYIVESSNSHTYQVSEQANNTTYHIPQQTNDGWDTAALSEVGINEDIIINGIHKVLDKTYGEVHSILIVKDGKLVCEEYFNGYAFLGYFTKFDRNTIHNLASVTKSVTSALVGIAVDHGFIQSVNEKVFSFFPEYTDLNNEQKDKITLEHLLTMTSGLQWDEESYSYFDLRNDIRQLFEKSDPIRYILAKPVVNEPGTMFCYSGGNTNVLGEVIRKATGLNADYFAQQCLFAPLGITEYWWKRLPNDVIYTSGDLKLRPRDMAKLGYLFLQKGLWDDRQIISRQWVETSMKEHVAGRNRTYGYQWWIIKYQVNSKYIDSYSARGWGGQHIIVLPELNMVVVFTGGNYEPHRSLDGILTDIILPAVIF